MLKSDRPRAVLEIIGEQALSLDGRELPREVGATLSEPLRVLCRAPGKWTLVSEEQSPANIIERYSGELESQGAVLIDSTDGVAVLSIKGPLARDVLMKGCGLDLHPTAFPVGRCARTRFAQMAVIIDHFDAEPSFRLYVARSYAKYLIDWITDAAVEFQGAS
jgi:sarcosine oxidase subunit gamma